MVGDLNKLRNFRDTQMSKIKGEVDKYLEYNNDVLICVTYFWG